MRTDTLRSLALIALAGLLAAPTAGAAPPGRLRLPAGKPQLAKVSSHLLWARQLAAEGAADEIAAAVPAARLRDGLLEVQVSLNRLTPAVLARLRASGLTVDSFHFDYARAYGRIDPADLEKLAAVREVATIHPMPRRGTRTGSATSQADATMNADDVRSTFGVDGSGVQVGILSDTFAQTLGGTASGGSCICAGPGSTCANVVNGMVNQSSGDLPPSIAILDDCTVGSPDCDDPSDEGAAIAELIFDVAPGAGFLFHSAFNGPADFADGIAELANCGAELLVDDVFYTQEPFFQDGVIAQAAQAAVDGGVPYFSATGNDVTFGINDPFTDGGALDDACAFPSKEFPNGDDLHDFGGGDQYAAITVPGGCDLYAELQWSEPFDGALGAGAASDLDLYLLSSPAPPRVAVNVEAGSVTRQGCGIPATSGGDPVEFIEYTNTSGGSETLYLAVEHCCGDEGVEFRIVNLSFNCDFLDAGWNFEDDPAVDETPIFVDAQIFGHPAAKDVMAVAAAFYAEIDSGGSLDPPPDQLDVEAYTSLGGNLPFYFDGAGEPLPGAAAAFGAATRATPPPPRWRFKPDITGPDGTNTTFFGDLCCDGDSFPNFFGTSAAAPNALGLAVLIWQLTGELISPIALNQLIAQASEDMEVAGPDALSGAGFVNGLKAASALDGSSPLVSELVFDLAGGGFLTGPTPPNPLQTLQAADKLTVVNGNYNGVRACAERIAFGDGFRSGDVSTWTNKLP